MAWFNIVVIVLPSKPGMATLKDYEAQKKVRLDPVPSAQVLRRKNPRRVPKASEALKSTKTAVSALCVPPQTGLLT